MLDKYNSYVGFVNEGLDEEIKDENKKAYASDIKHTIHLRSPCVILQAVSQYLFINDNELKKFSPGKKNEAKMVAIYFLRQVGQLTHQKIADYFPGLNRRSISKLMSRSEKLIEKAMQRSVSR